MSDATNQGAPASGSGASSEGAPASPSGLGLDLKLVGAGVAATALAGVIAAISGEGAARFLHAYLVSWMFFLTISLGALFFVAIQHVVGAEWSVVVRRLAELAGGLFPVTAVLFLPIAISVLAGSGALYPWAGDLSNHPEAAVIRAKAAWLSNGFFVLRCAIYLGVWTWLARGFLARSLEQDRTGDVGLTERSETIAAPGLVIFGVTITFAAFDLLMSLDPAWYSTIFGVYVFAGSVIAIMATLIVSSLVLQRSGALSPVVNEEHYHDMGKLLFGFVFFWGYIAFSQFMLIWYAAIPEETVWYYHRMHGGWGAVSLLLLFGHFMIPFGGLLSRHVKRNRMAIGFWAAWMLLMHWVDLYWLVMPSLDEGTPRFGLVEPLLLVGLGGILLGAAVRSARGASLVPARDPRLAASLAFHNA